MRHMRIYIYIIERCSSILSLLPAAPTQNIPQLLRRKPMWLPTCPNCVHSHICTNSNATRKDLSKTLPNVATSLRLQTRDRGSSSATRTSQTYRDRKLSVISMICYAWKRHRPHNGISIIVDTPTRQLTGVHFFAIPHAPAHGCALF